MAKTSLPAVVLALALLAGCRQQAAPATPVAPAPGAAPVASPAPAKTPARVAGRARNTASSRDGVYAGMVFPMAKAEFITRLNSRLGDNCKRPDRHGRLCPTLEQRSAICSGAVKRPVVADADAARDAGGKYLRCLHRGHL